MTGESGMGGLTFGSNTAQMNIDSQTSVVEKETSQKQFAENTMQVQKYDKEGRRVPDDLD